MKPPQVIYHRADFDGIFCREIARKFLPNASLIGWDYGDPTPELRRDGSELYMLDLAVPALMDDPCLVWIDHHKSSMEIYPKEIPGYRIDGVSACRLAWQWFAAGKHKGRGTAGGNPDLPVRQEYIERNVSEPLAVRLAGEYDVWDKRDYRGELFQCGLRGVDVSGYWPNLLRCDERGEETVLELLDKGEAVQYAQQRSNDSIIKEFGFTVQWEGLTFLVCNSARYNSLLFTAGILPEHDALAGFNWTGKEWRVSLYGVPGKPDVDLSTIARRYGGGGHRQACGFRCGKLPFVTF